MKETVPWPTKRRELHNHHFDSTIWNDLRFRDDDIVIAALNTPRQHVLSGTPGGIAALEIRLSPADLAAIEAAVPADAVAGTRYEARQMAMLDSERRSAS